MNKTKLLLERALKDPYLASPGECRYVNGNTHCIAGMVFHYLGVSDDTLEWDNICGIAGRDDLRKIALENGLDVPLLIETQHAWDDPHNNGRIDYHYSFTQTIIKEAIRRLEEKKEEFLNAN